MVQSYLTHRHQSVKYNDKLSDYESVKYSESQGSILGCTLFVIYVNDLLSRLPDNVVIAYAKDITLAANEFIVEEASFNLQTLLYAVHFWSTENNL